MSDLEERLRRLEGEIERRLLERFAALRDEFDRLRLESDRRWQGFLSRFNQDFRGIVPSELLSVSEGPTSPGGTGSVSIEAVRSLDEAEDQVEVLHRFLELSLRHASRVVLLIARGGALGVWKSAGFSTHGGSDEAVRRVTLTVAGQGALSQVLEGTPHRLTKDNDISSQLGCTDAADAVLVPMVVRERVSGAVYADLAAGDEKRFDPESIQLLTFLAGLVVDRLATRKLKPAPGLQSTKEEAPTSAPADSYTTQMMSLDMLPGTPVEAAPPPDSLAAAAPPAEPAAPSFPPLVRAEAGESTAPGSAPLELSSEYPGTTAPGEAARPPELDMPARPSGGARRLAGPLALLDGEERREEARRFAKLLVSEIKLYNERTVQEGRQRQDLYERLREDIDRSRQMYDERIPEDVRSTSNFFYEELVRILADGRPEALGI